MGSHVLVVDDEPELVRALCIRLAANGFTCDVASDGREALAKAKARRPDVIVLDLVMPKMDGYEVCRQLKSRGTQRPIPILVLTAAPEQLVEPRLAELGPVQVMYKPFDSQALLEAVRALVSNAPAGETSDG